MSGSISDRVRIDFGSFSDRLGLSQPSCHPRPTLETAVTPGIDARYCFTTETCTHGHLPYACLFIMPVNHRSGWFADHIYIVFGSISYRQHRLRIDGVVFGSISDRYRIISDRLRIVRMVCGSMFADRIRIVCESYKHRLRIV